MLTSTGRLVIPRLLARDPVLRLGMAVGAHATAEGIEDARLGGDGDLSTAWHVPLDQGFPKHEAGKLVFQATFGHGTASFDWREYGLFATESEIEPHHFIQGTGTLPVLVTRHVPGAPLHPGPKDDSVVRVLRVHYSFA